MKQKNSKINVDFATFIPSILISIIVLSIIIMFPKDSKLVADKVLHFLTSKLGAVYSLVYILSFVFFLIVAFSKLGNIKLGDKDTKPEFSNFSWVSMIFAAGVGITLMLFGFLEPIMYLNDPPFNIAPHSDLAYEYAHMYGQFHWGISAWAFYVPIAIPVAYYVHARKNTSIKISSACEPILSKKVRKIINPLIEIIVVFGILGGIGTSLGIAVPVISELISQIFKIENNIYLNLAIIGAWVILLGVCMYTSVEKGVKTLSNINIAIVVLFVIFVFLVGPSLFIFKIEMNSIGLYLDNILKMSFWTDPITQSGFFERWTAFYWGWWLSFAPMMGLFIAKISKGRTIKQVSLGMIIWGTLGSCFFFSILGGYSLYLEKEGILNISQIISQYGQQVAVIEILKTMPFSKIVMIAYVIIGFIFVSTTINSAAYVLASVSTKDLVKEPERWNKLFWSFILAIVAIALLMLGGLEAAQTSAIVGGTPIILVYILLVISFKKMTKEDFPHLYKKDKKEITIKVED